MGDPSRHLSESTQAFLLHRRLLGLAQVVIGLLQRGVELRLVGGERDLLAQLPQEFAFTAAEALRSGGGQR